MIEGMVNIGMFVRHLEDNAFVIVKEVYAAGYTTPDIGRIYTGFGTLGEALSFAEGLAQDAAAERLAPNEIEIQIKDFGDFGSVIVPLKKGRYVYTCRPALNVVEAV